MMLSMHHVSFRKFTGINNLTILIIQYFLPYLTEAIVYLVERISLQCPGEAARPLK